MTKSSLINKAQSETSETISDYQFNFTVTYFCFSLIAQNSFLSAAVSFQEVKAARQQTERKHAKNVWSLWWLRNICKVVHFYKWSIHLIQEKWWPSKEKYGCGIISASSVQATYRFPKFQKTSHLAQFKLETSCAMMLLSVNRSYLSMFLSPPQAKYYTHVKAAYFRSQLREY